MKPHRKHGSFRKHLEVRQNVCHMANLTIAQSVLNPRKKYLSEVARKRVGWVYLLEHKEHGNLTRAAKKIGVSREWLTKLYSQFCKTKRDPISLEPTSRAPTDCSKRNRVSRNIEYLIVTTRKKYPAWGKEKIVRILKRDHKIITSPSTVGRLLTKHKLVNRKLSDKNKRAWRRKNGRILKEIVRERPPYGLSDAAPGSLIAKDMKLVPKLQQTSRSDDSLKEKRGDHFWYQHTMVDSCSRYRVLSFVKGCDAKTAREVFEIAVRRFPFSPAACLNDNGSENAGVFQTKLQGMEILQFWSRPGTPTDNPRVERSHRSDDDEFYAHKTSARKSISELITSGLFWEKTWNDVRPHQALNYLTPKEFCTLWKKDQQAAEMILSKWNDYLAKQSKRLRKSRKEKRVEKIRALNTHLETKLGPGFTHLKV